MNWNEIIHDVAVRDRPRWLRVGTPCHLPGGIVGLIVDFDDTHLTVATRNGTEGAFPILWCGWKQ